MPHKKPKRPAKSKRARLRQHLRTYRTELQLLLGAALLLLVGVWLYQFNSPNVAASMSDDGVSDLISSDIQQQLESTKKAVAKIEDSQTANGVSVVSDQEVQRQLTAISIDLHQRNTQKARHDLRTLQNNTVTWQDKVNKAIAAKPKPSPRPVSVSVNANAPQEPVFDPASYLNVPILMYHDTPGDFEKQLLDLRAKHYTVIDLDQLVAAMSHATVLPAKSVVITFDDGYEDQMQAFGLLTKYQMKATFYIIDGGQESNWCIGAGRRYNEPSQPAKGCGDQYLTWDQVRQLDASGLITIGAHTINHRNLPSLSTDQQQLEIVEGKTELEAQLGHTVKHLAYPYGGFNATSIALAREAGFTSAVTTLSGTLQSLTSPYTLHRGRSSYDLP